MSGRVDGEVSVGQYTGFGAEAARVVKFGGWTLSQRLGEVEPKIRDLDLAERLGYREPRSIRRLIRRLIQEGKLPVDVEVRDAVSQTSGGRPGKEFWLSEAEALKVIAKSETPKAEAILDDVIAVYIAIRHGLLSRQTSAETARLREENAALRRRLAAAASGDETKQPGVIGKRAAATHVLGPLGQISRIEAVASARSTRSIATRVQLEARKAAGFPLEEKAEWQMLPEQKLGALSLWLRQRLAAAWRALGDRKPAPVQLDLDI